MKNHRAAFAVLFLAASVRAQPVNTISPACKIDADEMNDPQVVERCFNDLIAESAFQKQVVRFQQALDREPLSKDPEHLTKQLEAQLQIKEIIIKGREAQSAKWSPWFPLSSFGGALFGSFLPAVITWVSKRWPPRAQVLSRAKKHDAASP